MQNYSILKQERLKRGWSYETVEAKIGIPQRSQENAENGYHFPRQHYIELYCTLYEKSAEQLGLVKSGMIQTRISHFSAPQEGTTPMSEIIRRAAFYDLGSKLSSLIDLWPKRNYHYEELQGEINKAILDSNALAGQDSIYEVSRRHVLKSVGLVPIQLCAGLDGIINPHKAKADTDTLLKHCAAGIAVCWYLRRGKELVFTSDLISEYIKVLRALVYSKSEMHRKAAARLLTQSLRLKSKLTNALQDDDLAITYEEEAIRYALMADNVTEQAIANREMASLYFRRKKYKQGLPYAETAYGLAKNNKATLKTVLSFTASGLANYQASSGHLEEAQVRLKEAHDLFDPTMLIPSMPYGEASLTGIDAWIYQHTGNFKEAIDIYQQYKTFPTTALGAIQNNIEYAQAEVSRDDQTPDMGLCITLLTEGITGARELDSQWYIREAHEIFNLFRIAWRREDAIKKLGRDHFGLK